MGDRVQAIAFIKRHVGFNTNMILLARIRKEGEYRFGAMTSSTVPCVAQYMLNRVLYPDKTEYIEHLTKQTTQGFVVPSYSAAQWRADEVGDSSMSGTRPSSQVYSKGSVAHLLLSSLWLLQEFDLVVSN
jgi:hypothetical protein